MKKLILLAMFVIALLLFASSCNNAEFVWNPVGTWQVTITGSWGDTWTETLTFTGSDAGGSVLGWNSQFCPSNSVATWTRTGFTLIINLDAYFTADNVDYHNDITLTGVSSEVNPNDMSGSGSFTQTGTATYSWSLTFTAVKTGNPQ